MPVRLKVQKKLVSKSDRVKAVDLHPTEPWVLSSLYSGQVVISNYETQKVLKTFDVSDLPVRTAKFIARKQWIITGSDDMQVRVYNYNTMDKVKTFEAHQDYIRCIAVHPTQPLVLTTSDDMTIRMWNWEKNWELVRQFEGHSHYVMYAVFNPKDSATFATASLDHTIKVWNINSSSPNFTLEGHEKGINYVEYYHGHDKPFLISGADDYTAKVWDYQTKSCVQTLEGHLHNVSVCCFHPKLPIIVTGSEDGTVCLWNSSTYKAEQTLKYNMERVWAIAYGTKDTKLAIGFDEGTVVLKLGKERPIVTMDKKGKIIHAMHNEIQSLTIKQPKDILDGEKVSAQSKDLGTLEIYPETMSVSIFTNGRFNYKKFEPKGRYVAVCGDGEWTIFNAVSWKNKTFGSGEKIVWGPQSGSYAVLERSGSIKVFKNFKEYKSFKPFFTPVTIFGGQVICAKSDEFICLYDWDTCTLIRSIGVVPNAVYWNESGDYVVFACSGNYYTSKYNVELVKKALASGTVTEDGVEDCLEPDQEVMEEIKTGEWIGDCFIYTNNQNKLNYIIGSQVSTLAHLDKTWFYLGFVPKHNRIYLMDKESNIISYQLHLSVIEYQTAIVKGDLEAANAILPNVPEQFYDKLGKFLDSHGLKELAMQVTTDNEHKFELAIELGKLTEAYNILKVSESEQKWKQLGGIAIAKCDFKLAEECLLAGNDYNGLLLLYTSLGNREGIEKLGTISLEKGKNNIAFLCNFLLGKIEICIDLLIDTGRIPEAAALARTYMPSQISRVVQLWKKHLAKTNESAAERLADPEEYPNLFPDLDIAKQIEELFKQNRDETIPANEAPKHKDDQMRDLIQEFKSRDKPKETPDEVKAEEKREAEEEEVNKKEEESKQEEKTEEPKVEEPKQEEKPEEKEKSPKKDKKKDKKKKKESKSD